MIVIIFRILRVVDGLLDGGAERRHQWLTALTLMAFVTMLTSGYVLTSIAAPLAEKSGFKLVDLQFSGFFDIFDNYPTKTYSLNRALRVIGSETHNSGDILKAWKNGCDEKAAQAPRPCLMPIAKRAQKIDFLFAAAYGVFALLLAVALWRGQPDYPRPVLWVGLVALGAVAAVFDEIENIRMWSIISGAGSAGILLPSTAALVKVVLGIASLIGAAVALGRAHKAAMAEGAPEAGPPDTLRRG